MPPRPILSHFVNAPVVSVEPVGDRTVSELVPRQIQVAFRTSDDGTTQLQPLTPAAHELLYGAHRDRAATVLGGVAAALQGAVPGNAPSRLNGISLATDDAGYAVNTMMSLVENRFVPDVVGFAERGAPADAEQFRSVFQAVANGYSKSRANNSGWMDLGPGVSDQLLKLIEHGGRAGVDNALQAAQVIAHEQEHSISPLRADVPEQYVWLEEGTAEALSWWPGRVAQVQEAMGIETPGHIADRFTADPRSLASSEYRMRHNAVLELLDMAGVRMFDDTGAARPEDAAAARQLLQGDDVERVPRNLARAITRRYGLEDRHVGTIAERILASGGELSAVRELGDWVAAQARP